jgi:hypothetical protein
MSVCPQVCNTDKKPTSAPRCFGSAASSDKLSAAARKRAPYTSDGFCSAIGPTALGRVNTRWKYSTGKPDGTCGCNSGATPGAICGRNSTLSFRPAHLWLGHKLPKNHMDVPALCVVRKTKRNLSPRKCHRSPHNDNCHIRGDGQTALLLCAFLLRSDPLPCELHES